MSWLADERLVGSMKTNLIALMVVGSALVLGGCDDKKAPADPVKSMGDAADKMKDSAGKAVDATKDAAGKAVDATKDAAGKAVDATKEAAAKAADATKEAAAKATEAAKGMLDGKLKDAATGYTSDLTKLADTLGGIKSMDDATKAFPGIKDQMTKVSGYVATLSTATGDMKTKLMADYKPQIDAAVKKFKTEADRISKDMTLSKVPGLGDAVKNFKLFE